MSPKLKEKNTFKNYGINLKLKELKSWKEKNRKLSVDGGCSP